MLTLGTLRRDCPQQVFTHVANNVIKREKPFTSDDLFEFVASFPVLYNERVVTRLLKCAKNEKMSLDDVYNPFDLISDQSIEEYELLPVLYVLWHLLNRFSIHVQKPMMQLDDQHQWEMISKTEQNSFRVFAEECISECALLSNASCDLRLTEAVYESPAGQDPNNVQRLKNHYLLVKWSKWFGQHGPMIFDKNHSKEKPQSGVIMMSSFVMNEPPIGIIYQGQGEEDTKRTISHATLFDLHDIQKYARECRMLTTQRKKIKLGSEEEQKQIVRRIDQSSFISVGTMQTNAEIVCEFLETYEEPRKHVYCSSKTDQMIQEKVRYVRFVSIEEFPIDDFITTSQE
jgi:hypothetical protein